MTTKNILHRFFPNVFRDGSIPPGKCSFDHLTEPDMASHLNITKYNDFLLTDAIRPSYDLQVVPGQGCRYDALRDEERGISVPVLMASVTRKHLFETFMELLDPLGAVVDVVLETSHEQRWVGHTDLYREGIDLPVLKSILWDFEEMLTHDGCTGLAVLSRDEPVEIQFDEHKLLMVYGERLDRFETILDECGVARDDEIRFLTEAEHVHASNDALASKFESLTARLGMDVNDAF